ncbi:hypothetical protein C8F04DRAFT_1238851 [Mycena alexandri]|uniref:Uncharacterized protein n=1 Tax=Mycena alexandri TaxID=1745969 RepID=A0AAD6WWG8_9AGAR|nr:hypothetical protein C8F04DRAFT_1238851 [Mycena alexandri]
MFNKYALFFFASIATSAVAVYPLRSLNFLSLTAGSLDKQDTVKNVVVPAIDAATAAVAANDIPTALTNIVTIASNLDPLLATIDFQDGDNSPEDSNIFVALRNLNATARRKVEAGAALFRSLSAKERKISHTLSPIANLAN